MASVSLRGVSKTFAGDVEVVRDVSLDIIDGEFLVLVGPSGSGKSTLLRLIAGLERPSKGDVLIGDRVVTSLRPKSRDVAMVFQNYALYPHMTVAQNLAFSLETHKVAKPEVRRAGARDRRRPRLGLPPQAQARRALRRPAPAGGDGSSDGARSAGAAARRAVVEPRRRPAGRDADGAEADPLHDRDDRRVRHPRPGRSDDARRTGWPCCGRASWSSSTPRSASTAVRPTSSSPGSSARRR